MFTCSLVATLYVLLPKKGLVFALDGQLVYRRLWDWRESPTEAHREFAHWIAALGETNRITLDRIELGYRWAVSAVVGQMVLLACVIVIL